MLLSGILHAALVGGLVLVQLLADETAPLAAFRSGEGAFESDASFVPPVRYPDRMMPLPPRQERYKESAKVERLRDDDIQPDRNVSKLDIRAEIEQLSARAFMKADEWKERLSGALEVLEPLRSVDRPPPYQKYQKEVPSPPPGRLGVAQTAEAMQEISPKYPSASIRRGEQGLVIIEARVLADGRTSNVRVLKSSGYDRLDQAALEAVRRAKFRPARRYDQAVSSWVTVPIRFAINS